MGRSSGSKRKPAASRGSVIVPRNRRNAGRVGPSSPTIFKSMSSDMRRIRRCARLRAVPPPNTSWKGTVSAVVIAAKALTTYQSFSTSAELGNPKCA
jgi:hypothetical protein